MVTRGYMKAAMCGDTRVEGNGRITVVEWGLQ